MNHLASSSVRASPRSLWLLVIVAGALEAVYAVGLLWPMRIWSRPVSSDTHLVGTFGVDWAGATRYAVIVLALFALYGVALWLVGSGRVTPSRRLVFGAAGVFSVTLVLAHPLTSTDVFNYIVSARVLWVHGDNPLTTPPLAYPNDRFFALLFFWRDVPSPYGPLWSLLSGIPLALGGGRFIPTVVAFKALSAGGLLATAALVGATAERLRPGAGMLAAAAVAWNPLAVWHAAGNGHNDTVMVCLLALACFLLVRGLPGPAVVALTASALIKFATLLLGPAILVWWWRSPSHPALRRLAPWMLASIVLTVASYAPFWQGAGTFRTALDEGSYFAVSGPAALRGALVHVMSVPSAESLASWTGRLLFLTVYAVLLLRMRRPTIEDLLTNGALTLTAYVLLAAPYFAPWYVLWPLTLAAMLPWRRGLLAPLLSVTLGATSVLVWATWARSRLAPDPLADWYPMHLLSFASVVVPPLLVWAVMRGSPESLASPDIEPPVLKGEVARAGGEG